MIINFDNIGGGGGSGSGSTYVLPTATENRLGGIKVGSGLSIDNAGVLSADSSGYTLPAATDSVLGGVKIGSGITVDSAGTISVEAQSGGSSEALTISVSTMDPNDYTQDDLDAMQEMVDYLADFPVDALPAARIKSGGAYYTLYNLSYSPEDTENQTPEERHEYRFNYAEAYGDEGMDESQNGYIETFYLNAENVEESYNMYWDSSEGGAEMLSAVEDLSELNPLHGDVTAKIKSMVNTIHIDWSNLPFSEDMDVLEVGNLTLHAWDNNGTDTLTCSDGVNEEYITVSGDECITLTYNDYHWVVYRDGDYVFISLGDNGSAVPFEESFITLNDCDAQYDGEVIPDGLYQFDDNEGEWKPIISAGRGISIEDGAISLKIGDGLGMSGDTLVVSGISGGGGATPYVLNRMSQADLAALYEELSGYCVNSVYVSSAFPAENYAFFYDCKDNNTAWGEGFGGLMPLYLAHISTDDSNMEFAGRGGSRNEMNQICSLKAVVDSSGNFSSNDATLVVKDPEGNSFTFNSAGTAVSFDAYTFNRAFGSPNGVLNDYAPSSMPIRIVDENENQIAAANMLSTCTIPDSAYTDSSWIFRAVFEFILGNTIYRVIGDSVGSGSEEGWHLIEITTVHTVTP